MTGFTDRVKNLIRNVDLSSRSLLLNVKFSSLGMHQRDSSAEQQLKMSLCLDDVAPVHVWKGILPDDRVAPVRRYMSDIRLYIYRSTFPWSDARGVRLLPSAMFTPVSERLNRAQEWLPRLTKEHIDDHISEIIAWAQSPQGLGQLYNPELYTKPFADQTTIKYQIFPLPSKDTRVVLPEEQQKILSRGLEGLYEQIAVDIHRDLLTRLLTPISHMASLLSDDKRRIFPSVIENVRTVVDLASEMNILDDPELAVIISNIRTNLLSGSNKDMKKSEVLRKDTAAKAAVIESKLRSLLW